MLADLGNDQFYVRTYDALNYIRFDLKRIFAAASLKVVPLDQIAQIETLDATETLLQ